MGKNNTIKDMYQEDRPYEKCERFGAENLTDAELLAVLLRTGTQGENSLQLAHRLIESDCSGRGILNIHRWTFDQLMRIKGIGRVKAVQILCLSELAKRMAGTVLVLILYVFSLDKLGFVVSTAVWGIFWFRLFGMYSYIRCIIYSAITTAALWLVFIYGLGMSFPRGILG